MRPAALAALAILAAAASTTVRAAASPPAISCDDRTMGVVNDAKVIVIAKPKNVTSSTKDKTFIVRVTYTVDQALVGTKTPEVLVEETCDLGEATLQEMGYPSVERYCSNGIHAMPGLTDKGAAGTSPVALLLSEGTSELDGKPVMKIVKPFKWSPCPNDAELLKKRPALKDLVAKVKAANEKATMGLPTPPAAPAASASASASSAPPAPPPSGSVTPAATTSASAGPAPPTSSAPPPPKSGGCSSCSVTNEGTGFASAWPVIGLVVVALRRRRAAR